MSHENEIAMLQAKQREIQGLINRPNTMPNVKKVLSSLHTKLDGFISALQSGDLSQAEFEKLMETVNVVVNWDREDEGYAYES